MRRRCPTATRQSSPIDEVVPESQERLHPLPHALLHRDGPGGEGRGRRRSAAAGAARRPARARRRRWRDEHEQRRVRSRPAAPAPSAPQNAPKAVSITPTTNFMVFSGTRASGARTATPASATSTTAAPAAIAASGMSCWLLPNVSAMNATSSPSSSTPLNERVKAYQSETRSARSGRGLRGGQLGAEDLILVVQRLVALGAQHRLAQPLQAEHQQQPADHEAQPAQRNQVRAGPSAATTTASDSEPGADPGQRGAPVPGGPRREDDRRGLDRLDGAGQEDGEEKRAARPWAAPPVTGTNRFGQANVTAVSSRRMSPFLDGRVPSAVPRRRSSPSVRGGPRHALPRGHAAVSNTLVRVRPRSDTWSYPRPR